MLQLRRLICSRPGALSLAYHKDSSSFKCVPIFYRKIPLLWTLSCGGRPLRWFTLSATKAVSQEEISDISQKKESPSKQSFILDQKYIRNIAIIAHVDHGTSFPSIVSSTNASTFFCIGKTTLVDCLLRQSGAIQHELQTNNLGESLARLMDSNELEKERGITILSK